MTTAATRPVQTQYTLFGPRGTPYPGHPLVLAFLVMENFASIEEALAIPRGGRARNVFNFSGIPGSITNLDAALAVLKLARETKIGEALDLAGQTWRRSLGETFHAEDGRIGQEHAVLVHPEFEKKVKTWLRVGGPCPDGSPR